MLFTLDCCRSLRTGISYDYQKQVLGFDLIIDYKRIGFAFRLQPQSSEYEVSWTALWVVVTRILSSYLQCYCF